MSLSPDLLARVTLCPVRHHSPAAAMAVERALVAAPGGRGVHRRPRLVLVEGPSDATDLIPILLQPDTRPPVAILSYRPASDAGEPRTMVAPFCDYSPELVAMRVAARLGAQPRFFDAPAAAWLDREEVSTEAKPGGEMLPDASPPDLFRELAERFGFASHDEFWDTRFEMAAAGSVGELIASYGDMVRDWCGERDPRHDFDRARESWMLAEVARALEEGYLPEEIAIVCGAAHAAGLRAGVVDDEDVARLRQLPPARFALIPYSYPRLSEQSGYGAGNRAPAFYQEVWRRQGDWHGAGLDFLLRLTHSLRGLGYSLSLADAIEAVRLAASLAGLRGKPTVGLEELRDAATACYGRGLLDPSGHLASLLVGEEIGAVSALAAKTALQQEFHDQVRRYGVPFSDSPRDLRLNLTAPGDRAVSTFLHRLEVAGVPFARLAGTGSGALKTRRDGADDTYERLLVLREKWEVRWSPSTDVRLVELAVYGNTLVEVCGRLLRRRLGTARSLAEAADVLLDAVVAGVDAVYDEVLAACERASSEDDHFPSLCRASYLLDALVGYGDAPGRPEVLTRLRERVFARACLLLPSAANAADDEAAKVAEAMKALHQVGARRRQREEETSLLFERLGYTAEGDGEVHPSLAGLASAILYLDGHLQDDDLTRALGLRLSRGEEPLRAAQFVEGLFSLNRSVLVRNRAIVGSLSAFLKALEREPFLAVLPVLRRSLAGLSPSEMGYLVETIAAVLGIGREAAEREAVGAAQLDELAALDKELDDLFG